MPNSNTNKTLIPRLIITCLFHANTNIKEGLSCNHISVTQLKGNLAELRAIYIYIYIYINRKNLITITIIFKGVNKDLVYQLEHQTKVFKFPFT